MLVCHCLSVSEKRVITKYFNEMSRRAENWKMTKHGCNDCIPFNIKPHTYVSDKKQKQCQNRKGFVPIVAPDHLLRALWRSSHPQIIRPLLPQGSTGLQRPLGQTHPAHLLRDYPNQWTHWLQKHWKKLEPAIQLNLNPNSSFTLTVEMTKNWKDMLHLLATSSEALWLTASPR